MRPSVKLLYSIIIMLLLITSVAAATRVFQVQETDFVKINTESVDHDLDTVTYNYSAPLDKHGEWQTTYGDAGVYEVDVIASDGKDTTSKKVKIVVEKKNRAPNQIKKELKAKEGELINLKKTVADPDDDPLKYTFQPPFNNMGEWIPSYNDAGEYTIQFSVSDGKASTLTQVKVTVENQNQPPSITSTFSDKTSLEFEEGEDISFEAQAKDGDNEDITYSWKFDGVTISEKAKDEYELDYDSSGTHSLELTVSDGKNKVRKSWELIIENTNREPNFTIETITINENELAKLTLPETDQDGDKLTYTFDKFFNSQGEWTPSYNDAGNHEIKVTVSDGEFEIEKTIKVTVKNIDREPTLTVPEFLHVMEGEQLVWEIPTNDPDGDELKVKIHNAPDTAKLSKKTLTWTPTYDEISRSSNFLTNFLNAIRLEKYMLRKKSIPTTVEVCGNELCVKKDVTILVYNQNRAPSVSITKNLTITETETLNLYPTTSDPDGDVVKTYFGEPLDNWQGNWKTDHGDAGVHTIYLESNDGELSATTTLTVTVKKDNRAPSISVDQDSYQVLEGKEISFLIKAHDKDNDSIDLMVENPPEGSSFKDGVFRWTPPYNTVSNFTQSAWTRFFSTSEFLTKKISKQKEIVWLKFTASDGTTETILPVKLSIKNVNQAPKILDSLPENGQTYYTNEAVVFHVATKEYDPEELEYEWDFGIGQGKVYGTPTVERTFTKPGKKTVKVTVMDGLDEKVKIWNFDIVQKEESYTAPSREANFIIRVIDLN